MKSAIFIICILVTLHGFTQSTDKSYVARSDYFFDSLSTKQKISPAAIESFNKMFKDVENETWHSINDGSTVKFRKNNLQYHVFYNIKGKWRASIQTMPVEMLPRWISASINSGFKGFKPFFAQHIKTSGGWAYLVKIEKGNDWKMIKITALETEVLGEYVKN